MNDIQCLPNQPEKFFGLDQGYDRRDLKRAYGKAIRLFKPETHAAEFQLIRAAYERLERQLRYGRQLQESGEAAQAWTTASPTSPSPQQHPQDARKQPELSSSPELTLRQAAIIDPAATLKKLQSMTRRTPPDYFLSAVLADTTAGQPTARYLGHLIEGLTVFPADPGLTSLATEFLQTEVPVAMAEKIVCYVATQIRSPLFYMLTESLWARMVQTLPFENVESILEQCERSIRQSEPSTRATFYLKFLRSAIWNAPAQWTDRVLADLESQSVELSLSDQMELEFLSEIRGLLRNEAESNLNDPIRTKLLSAIQMACQQEEGEGLPKVFQQLTEVARDASGMQLAFPMTRSKQDVSWMPVIFSLIYQLQMYLPEPGEVPVDRQVAQRNRLIADLRTTENKITKVVERVKWRYETLPLIGWIVFASIPIAFPIITATLLLAPDLSGAIYVLTLSIMMMAGLMTFYAWIYPKYFEERRDARMSQGLPLAYTQHWRSRLFRYSQFNTDPIDRQLMQIAEMCHMTNRVSTSELLNSFVQQDVGLCLFSALQMVLR